MKVAIYPGSFDPVTFGHLDIIRRGARMFDRIVVVVMHNAAKRSLFSAEERVKMLRMVLKDVENVEVDAFNGLMVDYCTAHDIRIVIRGLRAVTDYEYELQVAQNNKALSEGFVDTVFLTTSIAYSFVSSSLAREIASYGRDVGKLVPEPVARLLAEKFAAQGENT